MTNNNKKILILAILVTLLVSGCGNKANDSNANKNDSADKTVENVTENKEVDENEVEEKTSEIADSSTDDSETAKESSKEPKQIAKPAKRIAKFRDQYNSDDNTEYEVEQELTYTDEGGYIATSRYDDMVKGLSYDFMQEYNEKGEIVKYSRTCYSSENPEGTTATFEYVKDYVIKDYYEDKDGISEYEADEIYGYSSYFEEDKIFRLTGRDEIHHAWVDNTRRAQYLPVCINDYPFEVFETKQEAESLIPVVHDALRERDFRDDISPKCDIIEKDNIYMMVYSVTGEAWNAATRSNSDIKAYLGADIILYNDDNLLESYTTYDFINGNEFIFDPDNLDFGKLEEMFPYGHFGRLENEYNSDGTLKRTSIVSSHHGQFEIEYEYE